MVVSFRSVGGDGGRVLGDAVVAVLVGAVGNDRGSESDGERPDVDGVQPFGAGGDDWPAAAVAVEGAEDRADEPGGEVLIGAVLVGGHVCCFPSVVGFWWGSVFALTSGVFVPEMGASNEPGDYSSGSKVDSQTLQVISPSARTALATRMRRGHWHAQAIALLLFFLASPPVTSGCR